METVKEFKSTIVLIFITKTTLSCIQILWIIEPNGWKESRKGTTLQGWKTWNPYMMKVKSVKTVKTITFHRIE